MKTVTYIIAAYRGRRTGQETAYDRNRDLYLHRQLDSLQRLRHDLTEILIVLNEDGDNPITVPEQIRNTRVRLLRRPNQGLSYGAFEYGVQNTDSEYVMLVEDDYQFTIDNFDHMMVERIESFPKPGFLCGAVEHRPDGHPLGGTVFLGIANTAATREILKIGYDGAPIVRADNSRDTGWYSQVAWSRMYMVAGYSLSDWLDDELACATWVSERHEAVWYDADARPGKRSPPQPKATSVPISRHASRRGVQKISRTITAPPVAIPVGIPQIHLARRSPIVPQQALDAGTVPVMIAGQRYMATLGADGRLR